MADKGNDSRASRPQGSRGQGSRGRSRSPRRGSRAPARERSPIRSASAAQESSSELRHLSEAQNVPQITVNINYGGVAAQNSSGGGDPQRNISTALPGGGAMGSFKAGLFGGVTVHDAFMGVSERSNADDVPGMFWPQARSKKPRTSTPIPSGRS